MRRSSDYNYTGLIVGLLLVLIIVVILVLALTYSSTSQTTTTYSTPQAQATGQVPVTGGGSITTTTTVHSNALVLFFQRLGYAIRSLFSPTTVTVSPSGGVSQPTIAVTATP